MGRGSTAPPPPSRWVSLPHLTYEVRLVEVKNPNWDAPTDQQRQFLAAAAARGIPTAIVEWEFPPDPG